MTSLGERMVSAIEQAGIRVAASVQEAAGLTPAISLWIGAPGCAFVHSRFGPREGAMNAPRMKQFIMKHRFFSAIRSSRPDAG